MFPKCMLLAKAAVVDRSVTPRVRDGSQSTPS
jgi:hypothetical protein